MHMIIALHVIIARLLAFLTISLHLSLVQLTTFITTIVVASMWHCAVTLYFQSLLYIACLPDHPQTNGKQLLELRWWHHLRSVVSSARFSFLVLTADRKKKNMGTNESVVVMSEV